MPDPTDHPAGETALPSCGVEGCPCDDAYGTQPADTAPTGETSAAETAPLRRARALLTWMSQRPGADEPALTQVLALIDAELTRLSTPLHPNRPVVQGLLEAAELMASVPGDLPDGTIVEVSSKTGDIRMIVTEGSATDRVAAVDAVLAMTDGRADYRPGTTGVHYASRITDSSQGTWGRWHVSAATILTPEEHTELKQDGETS